ncbi:hypothetical protein R1sor_009820 [Riccia sorocarpa]|uniref:DUF7725 domain-containing protein n=1 Tax=Riccia sorocarpa TaxID=122646 RepID=A0ABD3HZL1_9MARC
MKASVAVASHGASLPLQNQFGRKEWRVVTESNGRERIVPADGTGNQTRLNAAGHPRSSSGGARRNSRNGQMYHAAGSGHSSDSDHHSGEVGGAHMMGGSISPQELIPQNIDQGDEAVLYEEMHRPQQRNEHLDSGLNSMSMDSGLNSMDIPDDAFQQRLHEISRERERLQLAEVEMRAQYIARSEVVRMQNGLDEQAKQHAEIVNNLQGQIQEREQQIRHLEQQLEERERQLRVNQMETNEAVWAKDGLLREQTNELATLRRERDSAVSEHKAAVSQFEAERAELIGQLENIKEQLREKDRQLQEAEEQNRNSHDIILFKDEQMRDAQAWMSRATDMDAYYVNTNNSLHNELRERTEQMNNLWVGYQRQLADVERYHAQMVQRLQQELSEAREQNRVLMGAAAPERSEGKDERGSFTDGKEVGRGEGSDEKGSKIPLSSSNNASRIKTNIAESGNVISNGNTEGLMPILFPRDVPLKVEHATGIPVVPAPILNITPVLPPAAPITAIHPFGVHQQGLPPTLQATPVAVPQASLAQLQPITALLAPQQHLSSLPHQQGLRHHPQQLQAPVHRFSQRPPQQQHQMQPALPPHSHHPQQSSSLSIQGLQTVNQDNQHASEQVKHEQAVTQEDQHKVPVSQSSSVSPQQQSHNQATQQVSSQLLHQQHQSQSNMTSNDLEKSSPQPQLPRQEEQLVLPIDSKQKQPAEEPQKPELAAQHRQQNSQQDRQSHEQRRRLDSRLQQFAAHQQGQHVQSHNHQLFQQDLMITSQPQQLQHQQGISGSMERLGSGAHSSSPSHEGPDHEKYEAPPKKSVNEKELQKSAPLNAKQTHSEASSSKAPEPVLLDERSLLACLVRAVPVEPSARIRISSTLPNRLAKMLAPLHWHDYRKQFGRLDEFVGTHPELFVIEDDFIYLREGAHATVAATTAMAKAAAAAAAVAPSGPSRMPNVAVTPVAQGQVQRGRNLKGSNVSQKDKKVLPGPNPDAVPHSSSSSQSTNSRQNQGVVSNGAAGGNGNMNHVGSVNNGAKADSGSRPSEASFKHGSDNSSSYENGGLTGYTSARTNGYYGRQQGRGSFSSSGQYRKQDNHPRPHTQEGRILGSSTTVAQ